MVRPLLQSAAIDTLDRDAVPRLLLPDPATLFAARAARLRQLAAGEVPGIPVDDTLRGYLALMACLADAQRAVAARLGAAAMPLPGHAALQLAHTHNMPPLPATGTRPAGWLRVFAGLLDALVTAADPPPQLPPALETLRATPPDRLESIADAILGNANHRIDALRAPFVAAALQVAWSLMAGQLDTTWVQPLVTGTLCPVCGSHPVAGILRTGGGAHGTRYLHCAICESEWQMPRVTCSCCESDDALAYRGLVGCHDDDDAMAEPAPDEQALAGVARAETCDDCHGYRKVFSQEHDDRVEPLADDLASMLLDVLVSEAGYARPSGNPLLWLKDDR